MPLRDYQQRTIDYLYRWFEGNRGHPCLVLPTGSGKSHIIAELCRDVIQSWPDQKILILTHVKELIEQDVEKILMAWPMAPIGIFSASIGKKQLGEPITVAGIQSIRKHADRVGHVDLVIVDEAHLISHKNEGGYRTFIEALKVFNSNLRVIGLTATPYRLGHGLITDKPAIFDDILEPTSIEELLAHGYLSPLRSKRPDNLLSTDGVAKRGGEFIEAELQRAVNKKDQNLRVACEIIKYAEDRKAWLIFCTGVKHAHAMAELLQGLDVPTACITGETPKNEREAIVEGFKTGRLRALTNANCLTTGFDYPDIDLIAMCRPTLSPGLYMQMAGRGMRIKSHTDHCLVLDFAGNVRTHGPITAVRPPDRKGQGHGEAPVKVCENCQEFVTLSTRVCPACGWEFPAPEVKPLRLHDDDIMGNGKTMRVKSWLWRVYTSNSGKEMVTITYFSADNLAEMVTEYLCLLHGGYAQYKAQRLLSGIAKRAGVIIENPYDLEGIVSTMNTVPAPIEITKERDGKYYRVTARVWNHAS